MTESSQPQGSKGLTIAVVMPAYNAAHFLPETVPAAKRAAGSSRLLVVDAGSTDDSGAVAAAHGAEVVRLPERAGPAGARNAGVAAIADDAEVVLFLDSDCLAHEDVVTRVRTAFAADPKLVTLTGSYDDAPASRSFFSDYMNLRHHHTHQHAEQVGATFWSGCGAVRLSAFRAVSGFDAERFPLPMIEDIELGLRMRPLGTTRLDPDLNVKHLKHWTMRSVIATDVWKRAVPWTRLILEHGEMPSDLNLRWQQRLAAPVAPFALLAVPALPVLLAVAPLWAIVPAAVIALSWALSAGLLGCFRQKRGLLFAIGGWLFHQVHLIYSAATFVLVTLHHRLSGKRAKPKG